MSYLFYDVDCSSRAILESTKVTEKKKTKLKIKKTLSESLIYNLCKRSIVFESVFLESEVGDKVKEELNILDRGDIKENRLLIQKLSDAYSRESDFANAFGSDNGLKKGYNFMIKAGNGDSLAEFITGVIEYALSQPNKLKALNKSVATFKAAADLLRANKPQVKHIADILQNMYNITENLTSTIKPTSHVDDKSVVDSNMYDIQTSHIIESILESIIAAIH